MMTEVSVTGGVRPGPAQKSCTSLAWALRISYLFFVVLKIMCVDIIHKLALNLKLTINTVILTPPVPRDFWPTVVAKRYILQLKCPN